MFYRAIVKSVLTLQPGYSLRALKSTGKLAILMVRQRAELRRFLQRMSAALGREGLARLGVDCVGVVQWPYISKCWEASQRFDAVASHYEVVAGQLPGLLLFGRDEYLVICELSDYSPGCTLVLDRPIWFKREGELVLNLFQGNLRVASLAFTLQRADAGLAMFIGAVQGIHKGIDSETSLNIYRDLTKDFEGLRPRSLLIEALKGLARNVRVERIYAVADDCRHHRHPYFGADKAHELAANYDTIWQENGATASEREDFFSLPLASAQRAAEEVAPKKRAMYRRRQALLEALFARIDTFLPGGAGQSPLAVHRQRLGPALLADRPSALAPSWRDRLQALKAQLLREPRADQRFVAYLRKAGSYRTLRKLWRELRRQGPSLLWERPDGRHHDLPLAAPTVAASTLFPGDVLLVASLDASAGLPPRAAQLRQWLEGLGYRCQVHDWRAQDACLSAVQTCSTLILHRVPALPEALALIAEAGRLKVERYWDCDEQVFAPQAYRQAHALDALPAHEAERLIGGVQLYREALLACERGLAATPELAAAMGDTGMGQVAWVESEAQLGECLPALSGPRRLRVLAANIFFAPRSFGGATVVAEQMVRLLGLSSQWQPFVFTSLPLTEVDAYGLYRYEAQGATVLGMGLPDARSARDDFDNPATLQAFATVLASVAPDIVHLHSIQGLGALLASSCRQAGIPFVVTLHDAWWICARQFMIDGKGRYCGQTRIHSDVCATCVDDPALNEQRQRLLAETLQQADMLLAPSAFARQLYLANGFAPEKVRINRNGILPPGPGYQRQPGQRLRFGYVGGNTAIKGVTLISRAFAALERSDYELKLVDNLLNLGFRSYNRHSVRISGTVSVIPGYTQENIDEFFAGIDVLLFPTQWKETFGLAVREALVRDIWVVSTDAGGTVEDIVDGVNGTIIPLSADAQYLAKALADILDDPQRYLQHRNSFKTGITLCSDQATELQRIYQDVLATGVATGAQTHRSLTSRY